MCTKQIAVPMVLKYNGSRGSMLISEKITGDVSTRIGRCETKGGQKNPKSNGCGKNRDNACGSHFAWSEELVPQHVLIQGHFADAADPCAGADGHVGAGEGQGVPSQGRLGAISLLHSLRCLLQSQLHRFLPAAVTGDMCGKAALWTMPTASARSATLVAQCTVKSTLLEIAWQPACLSASEFSATQAELLSIFPLLSLSLQARLGLQFLPLGTPFRFGSKCSLWCFRFHKDTGVIENLLTSFFLRIV